MRSIHIVIADDSDLMIYGIQTLLLEKKQFEIVGAARYLEALLKIIKTKQPDIILLGEGIYDLDLLTTIEHIRAITHEPRLIIIGTMADGSFIYDLFTAGACGYLFKNDDLVKSIPQAVINIAEGKPYLSPTANAEFLIASEALCHLKVKALDSDMRSVLQLLAKGETPGRIAYLLNIPIKRVYRIRERLKRRFNARTNEHLITRAAAEGFVYINNTGN